MMMKSTVRAGIMLCTLAIFAWGCSNSNEPASSTKVSTNNVPTGTDKSAGQIAVAGDCQVDCIEEGGPYFEKPYSKTVTWGNANNPNVKTIDVIVYNTETDFVIKVKSTNGWSDLVINGNSAWTNGPVAPNSWGTYTYPLTSGWQACDVEAFLLQVAGNGPQASFNVSYNLIGVCPACETAFEGEAISCDDTREAVYTFSSVEALSSVKIQGGLTNFTGSDAVVTVVGGNMTVSQWTPGGSSNRIIKVEGSVDACEVVTITITWNSSNPGNTEITGDWSASFGDQSLEVAPLSCE